MLKATVAVAALFTLAGAAGAADLVIEEAVVAAPATSNWDGFYVGIFGGYAQGTLTTTDNDLVISPFEEDYEGYLLGLQAGYNFHLNDNVVGGFSADIAYNSLETEYDSYELGVDWSGSVTARLGLDMDAFVPYVLGGISVAGASITDRGPGPATDEQVYVGYVLGVGGEVSLTENVSANLEYRYTDYGTTINELTNVTTANPVDSSVRGGLNFRFN